MVIHFVTNNECIGFFSVSTFRFINTKTLRIAKIVITDLNDIVSIYSFETIIFVRNQ